MDFYPIGESQKGTVHSHWLWGNMVEEKKLTSKQEIFVREYLVDFNGTQAAIRAGYSKDSARVIASENLTKPYIQEYIQKKIDERAEKLEIKEEWILEKLKEVVHKCMNETKPIKYYDKAQKQWVETGNFVFDSSGANRALELLGKYKAMWKEYQKIEGEMAINPLLETLERFNDKKDNIDSTIT